MLAIGRSEAQELLVDEGAEPLLHRLGSAKACLRRAGRAERAHGDGGEGRAGGEDEITR